jgi:putative ABC transport system substrate-binding protein
MRRREFISLIGGVAATWPLAARAQQPAMPVIGFINAASAQSYTRQLAAFLKGLSEAGYVDGQNVSIEYRWAEGRHDRLPALVADLVQRRVTVIAATGTPAALAAKAANTTIPIVFETGADPIKIGLVADLSRPGGQVTGVSQTSVELAPKRLQLLHELIPTASVMALFVDPADGTLAEVYSRDVQAAARILGVELHILNVSNDRDLDGAFAKLIQLRAGGLVISGGAFFRSRKRLGGLQVDVQLDFGGQLDRQVGGLVTLENPASIVAGQAVCVRNGRSVTKQTAGRGKLAIREDRGHRVVERQRGDLCVPAPKECAATDHEPTCSQLD